MKAHFIDTHLLVPRSRSCANVKVKYQGHVSQKRDGLGSLVFHKHILFLFFSSPEREVLMVSFCDRSMSVVRRVSSVVHNFFKHLLLLNHWANLDETWQGCSLGEALPKLFKRLNSSHNSGCHGNQKEKK